MTELRGINWKEFIKDVLRSEGLRNKSLQWACSEALRSQKYMVIRLDKIDGVILEYKGCKFYADVPNYFNIFSVYEDYPFNLIQPNDTILDLGANIGAFSIPASKLCKKLYAVEPITTNLLERNIKLNQISNIEVLPVGISSKEELKIFRFLKQESKEVQCIPLNKLPRPDLLKLDIEGDEWLMSSKELEGIRVVTGEVHFTKYNKWKEWLHWFNLNGYKVDIRGSWNKEKRFTAEKEVL